MRITKGTGVSVLASTNKQIVSEVFRPMDPKNIQVGIELSAVAQSNAITFKLLESYNGSEFFEVGDQSEATLTSMSLASASDIANASDTFTETSHGRETGAPVIFEAGTAAPTGLTDGAKYYVINVTANTFKLAASYLEAVRGVPVSISDDGTGTQIFWDALYHIRMVESDATDAAQLPTLEYCVVAADAGASDTATVSNVYAS